MKKNEEDGVQFCPLDCKCLTECIVYKATLTANDGEMKTCIGPTEDPFKKRLYNADKRDRNLEKATAMSAYFWKKKDEGVGIASTKWELLKQCHSYKDMRPLPQ